MSDVEARVWCRVQRDQYFLFRVQNLADLSYLSCLILVKL